MNKKISWIWASLGLFMLSGCTTPPAPIDNNKITQAATLAISEAVYFREIFSSCAALGGELEMNAINTQQNWLNTNAQLVAAADSYYSQQQANSSFTYGDKTLAPTAIRLALAATMRARNELALAQRSPANKQKTCSFRLAQITSNSVSLNNLPLIAETQAELLKHLPLDTDISQTPKLAGGIGSVTEGKSFYAINKAHQTTCSNASTLSIANDWPMEAYANFCAEKAIEVISCEWGKCDTKKL